MRFRLIALVVMTLASFPAFAQMDLSGEWAPRFHVRGNPVAVVPEIRRIGSRCSRRERGRLKSGQETGDNVSRRIASRPASVGWRPWDRVAEQLPRRPRVVQGWIKRWRG